MTYAEGTSVTPEASRAEIERTLARYGADQFMYGWDQDQAIVGFRVGVRQVRFILSMPDRRDEQFTHTPTRGNLRSAAQQEAEYSKAVRQKWRALSLVVKAKLEAVESGITTFDEEFLAHILLPDGTTVGDQAVPAVERAYETGQMPKLLGAGV